MGKRKVVVYAIAKNEAKFVRRWVNSMSEADEIRVLDTGSDDETPDLLRKAGVFVAVCRVDPWRFDVARNLSLALVPTDADICVCTDLDEVFRPGWRAELEQIWTDDTDTVRYLFHWSLKPDGSPAGTFYGFKIHARFRYAWEYPIHECLKYLGDRPEKAIWTDRIVLEHRPDPAKSRGNYLPLLEKAVAEKPDSERMFYYLGREYAFAGEWQKCIDTLERYLNLPTARWNDERASALRFMADAYFRLGKNDTAKAYYLKAAAEAPGVRDSYTDAALFGYRTGDWAFCLAMAEAALRIREKSSAFLISGASWDETLPDLASLACYRLGFPERAVEYARQALEINPQNERIRQNLEFFRKAAAENASPGRA